MITELNRKYSVFLNENKKMHPIWRECKKYCVPNHDQSVVDSTASNAVEAITTSLLSELTPYSRKWIQLYYNGVRVYDIENKIHSILSKTNFFSVMYSAYSDLAMYGISNVVIKKSGDNLISFSHIPSDKLICGTYDTTLKNSWFINLPNKYNDLNVVECVEASDNGKFNHIVFAPTCINSKLEKPVCIKNNEISMNPVVIFKWKSLPESPYGSSPIIQNLSEIRSYNFIKSLMIDNAALSTRGVWHVDDDGVIDPEKVKLKPGSLIPKAIGSKGITPVRMNSGFDVSEKIIMHLQNKLEKSLIFTSSRENGKRDNLTATEIQREIDEKMEHLYAIHGRLQGDFIIPTVKKVLMILKDNGKIDIDLNKLDIKHISKTSIDSVSNNIDKIMVILDNIKSIDENVLNSIDSHELVEWIFDNSNVPNNIIKPRVRDKA